MLLISPHLDDAALSCSTRLHEGMIDLVMTCFSGIPTAPSVEINAWDKITCVESAKERFTARRCHDKNAWLSISQRYLQLDFCEHERSSECEQQLANEILDILPSFNSILLPAAVGGHKDHRLVRDLVLSIVPNEVEVLLYGELPYAAFFGWPDERQKYLDIIEYWKSEIDYLPGGFCITGFEIKKLTVIEKKKKIKLMKHYKSEFDAVTGGTLRLHTNTNMFDYELEVRISR